MNTTEAHIKCETASTYCCFKTTSQPNSAPCPILTATFSNSGFNSSMYFSILLLLHPFDKLLFHHVSHCCFSFCRFDLYSLMCFDVYENYLYLFFHVRVFVTCNVCSIYYKYNNASKIVDKENTTQNYDYGKLWTTPFTKLPHVI